MNRGGRAAIREKGDQVIGCIWFEPEATAYDGWLQIRLSNTDWWISDVFVSPDHRGEGIANQLGDFGRMELAMHGITNLVTVTNAVNYPALRSSEKVRYKSIRIWYVRFLGWTLVRLPRRWRFGWWGWRRYLQVSFSKLKNTPMS